MNSDPKNDLQHIRQMMERSSRFISLSGLSGVVAGVVALLGAGAAYGYLRQNGWTDVSGLRNAYPAEVFSVLVLLALLVLVLAVGAGIGFTVRKSKKLGMNIWTNTTKQLLLHLSIPLLAGGIFCIALIARGAMEFVAPATLVFYGLALVNASKFTYTDVQYLGYCEIVLGLAAMFFTGYGLLYWALGFGLLHIVYGLVMYRKYR